MAWPACRQRTEARQWKRSEFILRRCNRRGLDALPRPLSSLKEPVIVGSLVGRERSDGTLPAPRCRRQSSLWWTSSMT